MRLVNLNRNYQTKNLPTCLLFLNFLNGYSRVSLAGTMHLNNYKLTNLVALPRGTDADRRMLPLPYQTRSPGNQTILTLIYLTIIPLLDCLFCGIISSSVPGNTGSQEQITNPSNYQPAVTMLFITTVIYYNCN